MTTPNDMSNQDLPSRTRVRLGVLIALIGFGVLVLGTHPEWFGSGNGSAV